MKSVILFALFVAAAVAAPLDSDKDATVVKSTFDNLGVGAYGFGYETSNGIASQAEGQLINPGTENEAVVVRGQFSYVGPDGLTYTVTYTADQDGFHPQAAHLPQVA